MRYRPIPKNPPIVESESLSSATECTGLTPSAIYSENEADDYSRLYDIHQQKKNTLATGERKR